MRCFADCTTSNHRKVIVLAENSRIARFDNAGLARHHVTKFDGCVNCAGRRADFVVSDENGHQVIVELKGRAVDDAVKQISNTLSYLKSESLIKERTSALIVCSKVPLGVSSVQRAVLKLRGNGVHHTKVKCREWRGTLVDLF